MALADVKLEELHKEINDRLDKGEKLGDTEPDYYFAWPVPGAYSVSSAWAHAGAHITRVLIFLRLTARYSRFMQWQGHKDKHHLHS